MAALSTSADFISSDDKLRVCKRCLENEASQQIRSEKVCSNCFTQYVATKTIKRMETYRVRPSSDAPKKLLFPLSFGPSSASLLHILDQHLQGQHDKLKRTAYELHVIHIDLHTNEADRANTTALLEKYKLRFPRHTYSLAGLEEALNLDNIDWTSLNPSQPFENDIKYSGTERLQKFIFSISSATARADIIDTLLTRLLVDVSKKESCEAILFGDSTTKLAEKTLTQTAKGRGFSLPWQISDGMTPYGIAFNYPLRDLLKRELATFAGLTLPPISDLIAPQVSRTNVSASSIFTSIDDLMVQYFESVEENYPSIVANVVRTANKLKPLIGNDNTACSFCGLPVAEGTDGIFGWGGDQNSISRPSKRDDGHSILCYGCSRSING